MFPITERADTTLGTGRSFDEPDHPVKNDLPVTAGEVEGPSEFERRIATTGRLLRSAGSGSGTLLRNSGSAYVRGSRIARRQLGFLCGLVLTWCRVYGSRLARFTRLWLGELVAWSQSELPVFASACRRRAAAFAEVAGPAIQRGARGSAIFMGRAGRLSWHGARATGSGTLHLARRCVPHRSPSLARHRRSNNQNQSLENGNLVPMGQSSNDRSPQQVNLQSLARGAWEIEQGRSDQARAEFRAAREAYEGDVLRQLLERRLGVQVFPRYPEVTIDGLRFALRWNSEAEEYELALLTTCPDCGTMVASGDILHLADLGAVLDDVAARRNTCLRCRNAPRRFATAQDTDELDRIIAEPGRSLAPTVTSGIDAIVQDQPSDA